MIATDPPYAGLHFSLSGQVGGPQYLPPASKCAVNKEITIDERM